MLDSVRCLLLINMIYSWLAVKPCRIHWLQSIAEIE